MWIWVMVSFIVKIIHNAFVKILIGELYCLSENVTILL